MSFIASLKVNSVAGETSQIFTLIEDILFMYKVIIIVIIYTYFHRFTSSAILLLLSMKGLLSTNLRGCL